MKQILKEQRDVLSHWGFDPDKRVIDVTLGELFSLMMFAINRRDKSFYN